MESLARFSKLFRPHPLKNSSFPAQQSSEDPANSPVIGSIEPITELGRPDEAGAGHPGPPPPGALIERSRLVRPKGDEPDSIPLNGVDDLNAYLARLNADLEIGEECVVRVETHHQIRQRINRGHSSLVSWTYLSALFVLKRVFPRWGPTRGLMHWLPGARNHVLSLTEVLGRLQFAGFKAVTYQIKDGWTEVRSRKVGNPLSAASPTFGLIVRLSRVGLHGRRISLYKLRSMHPYAEFVQELVYQNGGLSNGDKFSGDFRVTRWGRFLRRYWLDELPMVVNLVKGDLKLVGVRPLSDHKLGLYSPGIRELRLTVKPGLVPPYYVDLPTSLEEVEESERRYIESYKRAPFRTDVSYLSRAAWNILIGGARSA